MSRSSRSIFWLFTYPQVILNSMHRYQPQIHIAEDHDGKEGEIILSHAFVDTQFIAVTAYQNTDVSTRDIILLFFRKNVFEWEELSPIEFQQDLHTFLSPAFFLSLSLSLFSSPDPALSPSQSLSLFFFRLLNFSFSSLLSSYSFSF